MNGKGTVDDQIFSLLNYKALVTTDVTDGFQKSMDINKADIEELQQIDFARQDGTLPRSSSSEDPQAKQSLLEKFFEKKNDTFNKRTKDKGKVIIEEVEDDSSVNDPEA